MFMNSLACLSIHSGSALRRVTRTRCRMKPEDKGLVVRSGRFRERLRNGEGSTYKTEVWYGILGLNKKPTERKLVRV
jgi:hypothetical protein